MIKSYLSTAFRNLIRHPLFSFLNLLGLGFSMAVCIIVLSIVKGQYDFDNFHKDGERIYRIITKVTTSDNEILSFATTPLPLNERVSQNYTGTENLTTVRPIYFIKGESSSKEIEIKAAFTTSSFFSLFSFQLMNGSSINSFNDPGSIVLSEETAEKFFGQSSPIGEIIKLQNLGAFKIIGVIKKTNFKSHLNYDAYISINSAVMLEKNGKLDSISNKWNDYLAGYTYVKLRPNINKDDITKFLSILTAGLKKNITFKNGEKSFRFFPQSLNNITPSSGLFLENSPGLSNKSISILILAVFVLLLLTCFNYSNLTIARSLTRTKEIGVRKVLGASRFQVFIQFLLEAILLSLIGFLFACILVPFVPLNTPFNNLFSGVNIDLKLIFFLLVFTFITGCIAGFLPGLIFSKFQPLQILKKLSNLKIMKGKHLTRALITIQFSISVILVINILIIYKQSDFMANADYGFNADNILNLKIPTNVNYKNLKNDLLSISGVNKVSAISSNFGSQSPDFCNAKSDLFSSSIALNYYFTDENIISNFQLKLISGENFWANSKVSQDNRIIVNEAAVKALNLGGPSQAIGRMLILDDTSKYFIIGVVKDFHFQNFKSLIAPMAFKYSQSQLSSLNVSIQRSNLKEVLSKIEVVYKKYSHENIDNLQMMKEQFQNHQSHIDDVKMIGFLSFLFLIIGCLGLLGISAYTVEIKIKEISIRKLLGASDSDIFMFLSKEYFIILIVSCLLGCPLGLILGQSFLNQFAYKIHIGPFILGIAVLFILAVGLITFGSQTLKSALSTPLQRVE